MARNREDSSRASKPGKFARLAEAVAGLAAARTTEEVIDRVRHAARQLTGASGVSVVRRDDDFCAYIAEDSDFPLWTGQRFPMANCISGHAMLDRQQILVEAIYEDPRIPHEAYRTTPIERLVMTPVEAPDGQYALGAYWAGGERWDADDPLVMSALAGCMASALANIRLVETLQAEVEEGRRLMAERHAAEAQVRFHARLLDAVDNAVIATDLTGKVIHWNRGAEQLYGWSTEDALGRQILDLTPSRQTRAEAGLIMARLARGESWSGEMVLRRRDGDEFAAQVTDSPIFGPDGKLAGVVGVSWDVTRHKDIQNHQQLLIHELAHRVKNTLAVIQSIARQSFRPGESLEEARAKFDGRLQTLAAAHSLLSSVEWRALPVRELVCTSLKPFGADVEGRFLLDGPEMRVGPKPALSLALALHELATNAAKYGALSTPEGRVEVRWWMKRGEEEARLRMLWAENGGPEVRPPDRKGFGARLLERALASELGGSVSVRFPPSGVVCEIDAPTPYLAPRTEAEQGQLIFPHLAGGVNA